MFYWNICIECYKAYFLIYLSCGWFQVVRKPCLKLTNSLLLGKICKSERVKIIFISEEEYCTCACSSAQEWRFNCILTNVITSSGCNNSKMMRKKLSRYNCCVNLVVINIKEGTVLWQYFSQEHTENVLSDWCVLYSYW